MAFLDFEALIKATAERLGYDPAALAAQAWQESRFEPGAVSPAGAKGIVQFMPGTWAWAKTMGWIPAAAVAEDPAANLQAAVCYMRWLLDRYKGAADPQPLAFAAYNCGQGNVDKAIKASNRTDWDGVRAFLPAETQAYVPIIMGRVAYFRELMGLAAAAIPAGVLILGGLLAFFLIRRVV